MFFFQESGVAKVYYVLIQLNNVLFTYVYANISWAKVLKLVVY